MADYKLWRLAWPERIMKYCTYLYHCQLFCFLFLGLLLCKYWLHYFTVCCSTTVSISLHLTYDLGADAMQRKWTLLKTSSLMKFWWFYLCEIMSDVHSLIFTHFNLHLIYNGAYHHKMQWQLDFFFVLSSLAESILRRLIFLKRINSSFTGTCIFTA